MDMIRRMTRRERFHLLRLLIWAVQVPLALATELKNNIAYVVFLSIAALVESALTDFDQSRAARKKAEADQPG
jgi:uncharacterized membrane protein